MSAWWCGCCVHLYAWARDAEESSTLEYEGTARWASGLSLTISTLFFGGVTCTMMAHADAQLETKRMPTLSFFFFLFAKTVYFFDTDPRDEVTPLPGCIRPALGPCSRFTTIFPCHRQARCARASFLKRTVTVSPSCLLSPTLISKSTSCLKKIQASVHKYGTQKNRREGWWGCGFFPQQQGSSSSSRRMKKWATPATRPRSKRFPVLALMNIPIHGSGCL